jgi:hypothetical protein
MLDELRITEIAVARAGDDDNHATSLIDLAIDPSEGPAVQLERRELRRRLADALKLLPSASGRFWRSPTLKKLTLAEIGRVFGIGESRVSQVRTQAILRLRSLLRPGWMRRGPVAMAALLTSAELDALRSNPSRARKTTEHAVPYDFRRPDRYLQGTAARAALSLTTVRAQHVHVVLRVSAHHDDAVRGIGGAVVVCTSSCAPSRIRRRSTPLESRRSTNSARSRSIRASRLR